MTNSVEDLLAEAGRRRWCSKLICTTCGATKFRQALADLSSDVPFVDDLTVMDLAKWYDVEDLGGAIGLVFQALSTPTEVDRVLAAWRPRVSHHTRLIDAVVFGVVRTRLASDNVGADWLRLARDEAVRTQDPSLLETLVYTLGRGVMSDSELLEAILQRRRGYAPLHRAINKTVGHLLSEA